MSTMTNRHNTGSRRGRPALVLMLLVLAAVIVPAAGPRAVAVAAEDFTLSLSCSSPAVEAGEEVSCSAVVVFDGSRQPVSYQWTPEGDGGDRDSDRVFRFDDAGEKTVTVRVCPIADDGREDFNACKRETEHITVDPEVISGLSCDPPKVTDRQTTTCRLGFASERAEITWTAGPNVTVGSLSGGVEFATGFTRPDTATITARGCISSANRETPRCKEESTTVEATQGPFPRITSLSCAPELLDPGDSVKCEATVENEPTRIQWSAYGGSPDTGSGPSFGTRYTDAGQFPISVVACVDGLGDPRCDTATATVRVAGTIAPRIRTLGCAPDLVPVGQIVSCSPEVTGGQDRFTWTAGPDASTGQGSGPRFGVTFSQPGTKTITLRVCVGGQQSDPQNPGTRRPEYCDDLSQPITVTSTTPAVESVACSPANVEAGKPVTCTARTTGPNPASWTWSADGGSPGVGTSATFSTTFAMAGRYTVRVQACISDRCGTGETSVTVTMSMTPRAPVTSTLNMRVTEQDLGPCAYSVMPVTNGSVTLTVTFGADGKPASATANLQGGGGGSRSVSCSGITARVSWSVTYSGSGLSGTVNASTGLVTMTGTVTGRQTVSFSDCKDKDGKNASCPTVPPPSWSYTTRLTGTITAAGTTSGTSTLVMDSGCSTSGTW